MTKIAINGFGRIGRSFFRAAFGSEDFEIVAINDLTDPKNLAYLLKYDTVYGRYLKDAKAGRDFLEVDGKKVKVFAEKDPLKLPWKDLGVDVVVESTGFFTDAEKARAHLDAGAKRVVISAPATGDVTTALIGVNDDRFKNPGPITCNASCTTNSVAPAVQIILDNFGIKKAAMTTVHGYTATQKLVDGPDQGRLAAAGRAAYHDHLTRLHVQVDIVQYVQLLEPLVYAVEFDHRVTPALFTPAVRMRSCVHIKGTNEANATHTFV